MNRARARVLVVGVGGIGCPAAMALARAGVGIIGLCDDDVVEPGNLHRQILFADSDVGSPKVVAADRALRRLAPALDVRAHPARLLPADAVDRVSAYDVVLEGADNFATKFLAADACALARVPVVHASAVRWVATALAVGARGRPCYRCLFEDVPGDGGLGCAQAGVMGPVVGVIAAAQVDMALAIVDGLPDRAAPRPARPAPSSPSPSPSPSSREGELVTFDGRTGALRRRRIEARSDCALCGQSARIRHIEPDAYAPPACAG